jgi:IS1 family transposase
MVNMNRLSKQQRKAVVRSLVEGNSIRATVRMTGVAKNTIAKLLVDLGAACTKYQDETVRNLSSKRLQCDEIWSFNYCKQRNVTAEIQETNPDAGDVWTWTCLDPDSKLMISWHVGGRTTDDTFQFISDVASRVNERVQISTDGLGQYIPAIVAAFGENVDLGQVIKKFAAGGYNPGRYSPPVCVGCENKVVIGDPDPKHISTSYIERSNLTLRMSMRRYTRLTNAFSRKVENHAAMVALFFMYYNFARVHQTLRVTPAMATGLSDHVWEIEEIVGLLEAKGEAA